MKKDDLLNGAGWQAKLRQASVDEPSPVNLKSLLAAVEMPATSATIGHEWAADFADLFGRRRVALGCLAALATVAVLATWQVSELDSLLVWADLIGPVSGGSL